jgi:hypothetical protein
METQSNGSWIFLSIFSLSVYIAAMYVKVIMPDRHNADAALHRDPFGRMNTNNAHLANRISVRTQSLVNQPFC